MKQYHLKAKLEQREIYKKLSKKEANRVDPKKNYQEFGKENADEVLSTRLHDELKSVDYSQPWYGGD